MLSFNKTVGEIKKQGFDYAKPCYGGEGGIRTHGTISGTLDFESRPL